MQTPTDAQMRFRNGLLATAHDRMGADLAVSPKQTIAAYVFLAALPEPGTRAECSEQIDALKSGALMTYARARRDWAAPLLARCQAVLDATPAMRFDADLGTNVGWTPKTLRAHVAAELARA